MEQFTMIPLLEQAIATRKPLMSDEAHHSAFRLFNGFTEGDPGLALVYGSTLVIHN